MKKEMLSAGAGCVPRESAVGTLRSGMAKDKLIFIIICSAAIGVAVITMASFLFPRGTAARGERWQCLNCDYEFSKKTSELPPIECPKCGGELVRVTYRKCPSCGAKVMCVRRRLSEQGKAKRDAMMKQAESTGQPVAAGAAMMVPMDMETQYPIKQADGSYGWTAWLTAVMISPQQAMQLQRNVRCTECDALIFPQSSRSGN
ncbi:hypothetical protein ES705_14072 [subsurface metagenome]